MKRLVLMLLLAGSIQGVYAQNTEKKEKFSPNTPLFEELTDVKRKQINSIFSLICRVVLMHISEMGFKKGISTCISFV